MSRILAVTLMMVATFHVAASELKVAVAANFAHTLAKVTERFEAETGHRVRISSGATGALYTQILHGAPYDLFLAADSHRPQLLEQEQKILPGSRITYAIGQLAYWQRRGKPSEHSLTLWQQKLAIANPRLAPYGVAAQQLLNRLNLATKLKGKLVTGSNILQAYQYVDSGNVQAGLVALSQLRSAEIDSHQYWVVPEYYHDPLEQQAVVLKRTAHPELALQLLDYLNHQHQLLTEAGYQVSAHVAKR